MLYMKSCSTSYNIYFSQLFYMQINDNFELMLKFHFFWENRIAIKKNIIITLGRRTKSPEPGRKSANWASTSAGIIVFYCKKGLKIPKGSSEAVIKEQTTQWSKEKEQKDKQCSTKHRKLRLNNTNPLKTGVSSGPLIRLAVPLPQMIPVVFLLNDINIIWSGNRVGQSICKQI